MFFTGITDKWPTYECPRHNSHVVSFSVIDGPEFLDCKPSLHVRSLLTRNPSRQSLLHLLDIWSVWSHPSLKSIVLYVPSLHFPPTYTKINRHFWRSFIFRTLPPFRLEYFSLWLPDSSFKEIHKISPLIFHTQRLSCTFD